MSYFDPVLTATADKALAANDSGLIRVIRKIIEAERLLALY
jgi:hypothetical protein